MSSSTVSGVTYAILAGASAASASVFGKYAMDPIYIHSALELVPFEFPLPNHQLELGLRGFCFGMIFVANALMWNFFVKSMNLSSSLNATVINSSLNYFFSAFFGYFLFGEPLPLMWWVGATIIMIGVAIISQDQKDVEEKETRNKKDD